MNQNSSVKQEPFSWLKTTAPEFYVNGDNIRIIIEPTDFFQILNDQIRNASRRITLASLYLGTGHLEEQLVSSMDEALKNSSEKLQIKVLIDFTRGSRGDRNSRTMLLPLLNRLETKLQLASDKDRDSSVQVALYHTPDLRGHLKRFFPDRWNEIIGLAHMKVYVIDDNVIVSGANLSNDYFTNRQDRYVLFHDRILADFFDDLVTTVSSFSLHLQPDNSLHLSNDWNIHPFNGDCSKFKDEAKRRIEDLIQRWRNQTLNNHLGDSKVYPLVQMGPLGINQDSKTTEHIIKTAPSLATLCLASGYFNLTERYRNLILNSSAANYRILTAAPKANGFFGARGIPGSIPKVYTFISQLFYDKILSLNRERKVSLYEYERPQWTFHAKGLWYYLPNCSEPSMTLIGSPNFGYRSVYRDLETQVAIVTDNRHLQEQLHSEQRRLFALASPVSTGTFCLPDRHVPLWIRLFTRVFKSYF